MDLMLLRMFQKQIALQCDFMLRAAEDVNMGLSQQNTKHTFYALQNLLNAGANVSKALWGAGGKLAAERKPLRDSIGVSDNSPLREVTMRNNFEHFDERLDRWWKESTNHNHLDLSIMSRKSAIGIDHSDWFRVFDPATTDITFWSQDFNLQQLIDEVRRILPKLQAEANKPHWE